jgi:hypothetical protein
MRLDHARFHRQPGVGEAFAMVINRCRIRARVRIAWQSLPEADEFNAPLVRLYPFFFYDLVDQVVFAVSEACGGSGFLDSGIS